MQLKLTFLLLHTWLKDSENERLMLHFTQVWQNKLSSLNCATFPWDPPPAAAQAANPSAATSNGSGGRAVHQAQAVAATGAGGVQIKTEAGESSNSGGPSVTNPQAAAQRAANLMAQKFGNNQAQVPTLSAPPGGRAPTAGQASTNAAASYQQHQPPNGVAGAQSDGGGDGSQDWGAVMTRRNAQGEEELGRVEVDGLLRRQIEEMGQRMEGGGLMLPLHERPKPVKGKKPTANVGALVTPSPFLRSEDSSSALTPKIAQVDGGDDSSSEGKPDIKDEDDEVDEDAINSELDDPDDAGPADNDDDESMTQIMLCMYDKVQRVKNKWKCTLKDGVLSVNGKESVTCIRWGFLLTVGSTATSSTRLRASLSGSDGLVMAWNSTRLATSTAVRRAEGKRSTST